MAETASEALFEKFLDDSGYDGMWDYEPDVPGQKKKPDYKLAWKDRSLFFEVKELHKKRALPKEATYADFYTHIRDEINEAQRKFKKLKNEICSVVLHNIDDWEVRLEPLYVLGAMLGNLGSRMDYNPETGVGDAATLSNVFLPAADSPHGKGGKMRNPYSGKPQNTRISSIIVLEIYRDRRRVDTAAKERRSEREKALGRKLSPPEGIEVSVEAIRRYGQFGRNVPRAVVIDNPFARNPFPDGLFHGEFDEHWQWDPNTERIVPIFRGSALQAEGS